MLLVAKFFAQQVIWLVPVGLVSGWLRGGERTRIRVLQAAVAGLAGLLINQLIGLFWPHPRPFVVGQGHTFLSHAPDSSFPSDHLTLLWCVAFTFLMHPRLRAAGAALVASVSAYLCFREERGFMDTVYRGATRLYHQLFSIPIRRGWVRY